MDRKLLLVAPIALAAAMGIGLSLATNTASGGQPVAAAPHPAVLNENFKMTIVTDKKGGPADWPAFEPSVLTVKAGSRVTITLKNNDDGADPVSATVAKVRGTVGGVKEANGKTFRALPMTAVSHTFTILSLGINVPIPASQTVTFTFKAPTKPGTYSFICVVPCGTGASGWEGPMASKNYMIGTIIVKG